MILLTMPTVIDSVSDKINAWQRRRKLRRGYENKDRRPAELTETDAEYVRAVYRRNRVMFEEKFISRTELKLLYAYFKSADAKRVDKLHYPVFTSAVGDVIFSYFPRISSCFRH